MCAHRAVVATNMTQRKGLEETKALFPRLRKQIEEALARLEQQLVRIE